MQFELHCRPFHIVGFNAHDLVPKAMINPWEYSTEGGCCWFLAAQLFANAKAHNLASIKSIPGMLKMACGACQ